jgi:hypothetical protein
MNFAVKEYFRLLDSLWPCGGIEEGRSDLLLAFEQPRAG